MKHRATITHPPNHMIDIACDLLSCSPGLAFTVYVYRDGFGSIIHIGHGRRNPASRKPPGVLYAIRVKSKQE